MTNRVRSATSSGAKEFLALSPQLNIQVGDLGHYSPCIPSFQFAMVMEVACRITAWKGVRKWESTAFLRAKTASHFMDGQNSEID